MTFSIKCLHTFIVKIFTKYSLLLLMLISICLHGMENCNSCLFIVTSLHGIENIIHFSSYFNLFFISQITHSYTILLLGC